MVDAALIPVTPILQNAKVLFAINPPKTLTAWHHIMAETSPWHKLEGIFIIV